MPEVNERYFTKDIVKDNVKKLASKNMSHEEWFKSRKTGGPHRGQHDSSQDITLFQKGAI